MSPFPFTSTQPRFSRMNLGLSLFSTSEANVWLQWILRAGQTNKVSVVVVKYRNTNNKIIKNFKEKVHHTKSSRFHPGRSIDSITKEAISRSFETYDSSTNGSYNITYISFHFISSIRLPSLPPPTKELIITLQDIEFIFLLLRLMLACYIPSSNTDLQKRNKELT
jgi:hypothetical protein